MTPQPTKAQVLEKVPLIKKDEEGCIMSVSCRSWGQPNVVSQEIENQEIEKIPDSAKLLSLALKLESLKIGFDQMIRKLRGIVNYYEGTGNTAED